MSRFFCIALLVLGFTGMLGAQADPHPTLAIGSAAPDFALTGIDGKIHKLSDYSSARVLVIVFTCNHCPTAQLYEGRIKQLADDYRGRYKRNDPDAGARYARDLAEQVGAVGARGRRLAAFIAESCPSVGGQIIFPPGYLPGVYDAVRAAGGVCIADEVQTGLGRIGTHFWAFEAQGVVPDIVVLGKPLGNGHPMGAVVTTAAIARSFDNGIEFFSTFGGSTLSCRVGTEVLRIVEEEGLQTGAEATGARLLDGLRELQARHEVIGDVRGIGLFVGVDLVTDRDSRSPATGAARYVKNRLRQERILVGTEGPADNVLKIRPPLTVDADDIDHLLATLDQVLGEAPAQPTE